MHLKISSKLQQANKSNVLEPTVLAKFTVSGCCFYGLYRIQKVLALASLIQHCISFQQLEQG